MGIRSKKIWILILKIFLTLLKIFFSLCIRINLINPLHVMTSNKSVKYNTTRYKFDARHILHDADLKIIG